VVYIVNRAGNVTIIRRIETIKFFTVRTSNFGLLVPRFIDGVLDGLSRS